MKLERNYAPLTISYPVFGRLPAPLPAPSPFTNQTADFASPSPTPRSISSDLSVDEMLRRMFKSGDPKASERNRFDWFWRVLHDIEMMAEPTERLNEGLDVTSRIDLPLLYLSNLLHLEIHPSIDALVEGPLRAKLSFREALACLLANGRFRDGSWSVDRLADNYPDTATPDELDFARIAVAISAALSSPAPGETELTELSRCENHCSTGGLSWAFVAATKSVVHQAMGNPQAALDSSQQAVDQFQNFQQVPYTLRQLLRSAWLQYSSKDLDSALQTCDLCLSDQRLELLPNLHWNVLAHHCVVASSSGKTDLARWSFDEANRVRQARVTVGDA